jgi:hypothetical protein
MCKWINSVRQIGGWSRANGGDRNSPNEQEQRYIAEFHPAKTWSAMKEEDRILAVAAFASGVEAEAKRNA